MRLLRWGEIGQIGRIGPIRRIGPMALRDSFPRTAATAASDPIRWLRSSMMRRSRSVTGSSRGLCAPTTRWCRPLEAGSRTSPREASDPTSPTRPTPAASPPPRIAIHAGVDTGVRTWYTQHDDFACKCTRDFAYPRRQTYQGHSISRTEYTH